MSIEVYFFISGTGEIYYFFHCIYTLRKLLVRTYGAHLS
jgi:hypothetical protein